MHTMLVSDFKAKAIATLKRVKQTGEPVLVTLRGKPLAEVVPVQAKEGRQPDPPIWQRGILACAHVNQSDEGECEE